MLVKIAALDVGDLHQNRGFDALRVIRKGGRREALAINPQTALRIRAYLIIAGHGNDVDGPLFRPVRGNAKPPDYHALNQVGADGGIGAVLPMWAAWRSGLW